MTKPNANEKALAKQTIALLKRAENVAIDLNLYLICREVDETFQTNGRTARGAIALALDELRKIAGIPAEVPDVAAAEG